ILHRNPVSQATTDLLSGSAPMNKQALAAVPEIHRLIDETLLALVDRHQHVSVRQTDSGTDEGVAP
ncbi:MAG: hypothetical protein QGI09_10875, partial [Dehalococcoidia bacterium]|nr:hypothetical protein [Dehalococcoidia bacterium]